MSEHSLSRRQFIGGAGGTSAAVMLRGSIPGLAAALQAACTARDEGAAFRVLSADEAAAVEAISARLIPTTDTPGAREAGVVWFVDQALSSFMAHNTDFFRGGLAEFEAALGDGGRFAELDEPAQDAHLEAQQETPFFGFFRMLTLLGTFGMPHHGGNRDYVGWRLLGIDPAQHAYQPPFGYYDAEHREESVDGD